MPAVIYRRSEEKLRSVTEARLFDHGHSYGQHCPAPPVTMPRFHRESWRLDKPDFCISERWIIQREASGSMIQKAQRIITMNTPTNSRSGAADRVAKSLRNAAMMRKDKERSRSPNTAWTRTARNPQ